MEQGRCRLCHAEAALHASHIIPSFVHRWIRKDGPTPFLRLNDAPNKRRQDGVKRYWLCSDCEQRLSGFEREFATHIFHPTIDKGVHRIAYGRWLLKFCVSLSWRALLMTAEHYGFATWPEPHKGRAPLALEAWRRFLRDEVEHPGEFVQHLLVFTPWGEVRDDVPRNINHYLQIAIELDISFGPDIGNTYVKFGPFIILGFFVLRWPNEWRTSRISLKQGSIAGGKYLLPGAFREHLFERARGQAALYKDISPQQKSIIREAWARDADRIKGTRSWQVLQLDLALFGDEVLDVY